ncbi:MAG: VRR-NUC domain-containing protein [Bacillota bacterium]
MRETAVEYYLRDEVKAIGGRAYKFVSPGNSGVPDRLVCLPGGIKIFVETKAPGKKPTPKQKAEQARLIRLGNLVFNIDNKPDVDEFIKYCKGLIKQ